MLTLKQINDSLGPMGTDKGNDEHTFAGRSNLDIYDPLFGPLRDSEFDLVEIGIHCGGSLHLWERAFPRARIHAVDINPECKPAERARIQVTIGSQDDPEVISTVLGQCSDLRLVIDDGSHLLKHMLATFDGLWPALKSGGLYIFEDTSTTYWGVDQGWPGMSLNQSPLVILDRGVFNERILEWIKAIDHRKGDIRSVACFYNLMVLEKV
jgi:hypothetical protein